MIELISQHFTLPSIITSTSIGHYWRLKTLGNKSLEGDSEKALGITVQLILTLKEERYIYSVES